MKIVNDKSLEIQNITEDEFVHIYSFYSKNKTNKRLIIGAITFMDAVELLKAFNNWYSLEYEINEYIEETVQSWIYINICKIDPEYKYAQRFISEKEYEELKKYIDNKLWANTHHSKIMTKNLMKNLYN